MQVAGDVVTAGADEEVHVATGFGLEDVVGVEAGPSRGRPPAGAPSTPRRRASSSSVTSSVRARGDVEGDPVAGADLRGFGCSGLTRPLPVARSLSSWLVRDIFVFDIGKVTVCVHAGLAWSSWRFFVLPAQYQKGDVIPGVFTSDQGLHYRDADALWRPGHHGLA
jgi:hypothetical protein